MTEMKDKDKDDNCWPLWSRSSVEVGVANTTTNHRGEHCRRVGGGLQKEQRETKRGTTMCVCVLVLQFQGVVFYHAIPIANFFPHLLPPEI